MSAPLCQNDTCSQCTHALHQQWCDACNASRSAASEVTIVISGLHNYRSEAKLAGSSMMIIMPYNSHVQLRAKTAFAGSTAAKMVFCVLGLHGYRPVCSMSRCELDSHCTHWPYGQCIGHRDTNGLKCSVLCMKALPQVVSANMNLLQAWISVTGATILERSQT